MKILLISDLYPLLNDDTIPSVLWDFARAFVEKGAQVSVIRPNFLLNSFIRKHRIYKTGLYQENGIDIYNRNFITPFLKENLDFLKEKYDLIISHMPSGHIYASLINEKLNISHIAILHNSDFRVLNSIKYKFYFKQRLIKALKKAHVVGARNEKIFSSFGADFLLPSYIEKEYIVKKKQINDKDKLKIITLSRLIKRKNIDIVIRALSQYSGDFEYNIYGSGKEKDNLEKLIKKYHLEDKIKIHSKISHNLVYEKLDEHDIFILPSVNETFGICYLEAMARGLITIAAKGEGMDGIIKNNINGFLINPNQKETLGILNKINFINKEELIKNTLLEIKNYQKEKIMNKYFEIIKKVL